MSELWMPVAEGTSNVTTALKLAGYAFARLSSPAVPGAGGEHWDHLRATWDDLPDDEYMRGKPNFRQRRYGRFLYETKTQTLTPFPQQPYFQAPIYNSFAGGIERHYSALSPSLQANPLLHDLIQLDLRQFPLDERRGESAWVVGVHQFRIKTWEDVPGEPTPEGVHRDGHEFFAVHLIERSNVIGGVSLICDDGRRVLERKSLGNPLDSLFVVDQTVLHAVTPIRQGSKAVAGVRDVLIIEFDDLDKLRRARGLPRHIVDRLLEPPAVARTWQVGMRWPWEVAFASEPVASGPERIADVFQYSAD